MSRLFISLAFASLFITSAFCTQSQKAPVPGANQIEQYKSVIEGKSVAVVAN